MCLIFSKLCKKAKIQPTTLINYVYLIEGRKERKRNLLQTLFIEYKHNSVRCFFVTVNRTGKSYTQALHR